MAFSRHHVGNTRATWLHHAEKQAEADVRFAIRHPEVVPTLRITQIAARDNRAVRLARWLAERPNSALADLTRTTARAVAHLERIGLRSRGQWLLELLATSLYWCRAVQTAGGKAALKRLIGHATATLGATLPIQLDLDGPPPEVGVARYYERLQIRLVREGQFMTTFQILTHQEVVSGERLGEIVRRIVVHEALQEPTNHGVQALARAAPSASRVAWLDILPTTAT